MTSGSACGSASTFEMTGMRGVITFVPASASLHGPTPTMERVSGPQADSDLRKEKHTVLPKRSGVRHPKNLVPPLE